MVLVCNVGMLTQMVAANCDPIIVHATADMKVQRRCSLPTSSCCARSQTRAQQIDDYV